jgi:putative hydrolase of the HAD superfamily
MIKNIIFDIGNVLVRWDPLTQVARFFPPPIDAVELTKKLFKSTEWFALNLGKITEAELIETYHQQLGIDKKVLSDLMQAVKDYMLPLPGSFELLKDLYQAGIPLYALTDSTQEIVKYLQQKYDFWRKFKGIVVSAEIGYMKPSPYIYQYLLNTYQLNPTETVFIDDYLPNIEGAKQVDLQAIQFENAKKCVADLQELNLLGWPSL